jgi:alpha-tubulin suppressor-like RCC1 family protein
VFVSAGGFHSCAVFKGGQGVSAWGRGGEGQLGNEERFTIDLPKKMTSRILDDGEHEGLYGQKIQQVACGLWHTIILTTSGLLFACGRAMEGQLGIEEPFPYVLLPCRLHSLYKDRVIMTSIAAGKDHTIALDNKKRVWAWGSNANGQLGVGKFEAEAGKDLPISEVPRLVSGLEDVDVQEIFCSAETSAVLDAKGRLFTWGKGKCMSLGTMDEEDVFEPGQMAALDGFSIVHVGVGDKHMVALMNSASSNKQVVRTASVSSTGTHSHGRGSPDSQGKQSAYAGGSPSSDTQRQDSPTPAGGGLYTSIQAYGQGVGKGGAEVTSILGGMFGGGGSRSDGQRGAMA